MADFIVLRDWEGKVPTTVGLSKIPAGSVISDTEHDIGVLFAAGLRVIELDTEVLARINANSEFPGPGAVGIAALVTLFGRKSAFGSFSIDTPAGTVITSGTPEKIAGTTLTSLTDGLTVGTMRITNENAFLTARLTVHATFCATSVANNVVVTAYVAKGDTTTPAAVILASAQQTKIGTGTDVESISLIFGLDLEPGEFLEPFIDVDTSTTITAGCGNMLAVGAFLPFTP